MASLVVLVATLRLEVIVGRVVNVAVENGLLLLSNFSDPGLTRLKFENSIY